MILLNSNLEAFMAVCELATISAAAKRLGLTQTGATQRIKALERDLDVALFTRSRTGMKPTSEGESLLRSCQEAKLIEGRLLLGLKKGGDEQDVDLSVVGPASLIAGRIVYQCRHVYAQWPRLNLRFIIDVNANRLNHLKRGTAELAIVLPHEVTQELDSKLLKPVEYVLVCSSEWKSRPLREVLETERLFAYHPGDSTGLDYLEAFGLAEQLKKPRLYVNENQALENLLALGVGFGVLPRELAKPFIDDEKLVTLNHGSSMKIPMALAWYPRREMPSYFKEIVRSIK